MTSPGLAKAPLRLICLPLCRKPELIYYYAHKRREPRSQSSQSSEGKGKLRQMLESREAVTATSSSSRDAGATLGSGPGVASTSTQQEHQVSYGQQIARRISQVTNYAGGKWEELGKAGKDTWKYKAYMRGENLMDRIEYEEWLLKALDASTAPRLLRRSKPSSSSSPTDGSPQSSSTSDMQVAEQVPLYFPPSLYDKSSVMQHFSSMLDHREPHHSSLMKKSLAVVPFTIPFALIPIVPNFPMFYVLWRAWSHWRALQSSQYLKGLLEHDQLSVTPSDTLDEIYKSAPGSSGEKSNEDTPKVLLTHDMVDTLIKRFELGDQAGVDLRRAIAQTEARLKSIAADPK